MIRMIGNNTSDYVATDLIHQLWCQHDDKYGHLFLDEPHQSKRPCTFIHKKKTKPINFMTSHVYTEDRYYDERLKENQKEENDDKSEKKPESEKDEEFIKDLLRDDDEYTNLLRKRISSLLKRQRKKTMKQPKVVTLINDSTTNSDDTASRSEQDFNQHYAREEAGLNEHL